MIKKNALRYLGYRNSDIPKDIDSLIDECIVEIKEISVPQHMYTILILEHNPLCLGEVFTVDINHKELITLFKDCPYCIIVACTLGIDVDKRLQYYSKFDMTKMTILDAVASSYLEYVCDDIEKKTLPTPRTVRFCPGYGTVPITLNKKLANLLGTSRHIGLTVQDSSILLPQKSMIGLIGYGSKSSQKQCYTCICEEDCQYKEGGPTCYVND